MGSRGPWRTTYPKGPVAGMYSNPGPKYAVPSGLMSASTGKDRNYTLYQSAAYTVAPRYGDSAKTIGPGPAAYKPDPRYTNHGKSGGPYAFSTWKPHDPLEKKTPGPTDYDTRVKPNVWSKLKGVKGGSLGTRAQGYKVGIGPGPSAYAPSYHGHRAPQAVLSDKHHELDRNTNPGPGQYDHPSMNRYKKGTPPSFSMTARRHDRDMSKYPSPLTYRPEPGYKKTLKQPPAFSFGNHHSQYSSRPITHADKDGDCDDCALDDYCRDTAPPKPDDCPKVVC